MTPRTIRTLTAAFGSAVPLCGVAFISLPGAAIVGGAMLVVASVVGMILSRNSERK
jgi:hypothetical protein